MDKLLKFMEFGCIDNKLYWRIPHKETDEQYEIQWRKDHPVAWRYRRLGDLFWKLSSSSELEENLIEENVDVIALESKVRYSVLQQVAFADRIMRDAWECFGREVVDQAVWENQRFLEQLEQAVQRLTSDGRKNAPQPRSRLTLVKSASESTVHHHS